MPKLYTNVPIANKSGKPVEKGYNMARDIVVLAYSGGLDTSVCLRWLQDEMDLDIVAVVGEVGQEHDDLEITRKKALDMGCLECRVIDMRQELADNYLTWALAANAKYEKKYPLLSALTRPVISKYLVDVAGVSQDVIDDFRALMLE